MADISRLPGPVSTHWDWQLLARCRESDSRLFFHTEGERGRNRRNRAAAAIAICNECPVLAECRAHALAVREPYGTWGGLSEDEREAMLKPGHRTRSRPSERDAEAHRAEHPAAEPHCGARVPDQDLISAS